MTGPSIPSTLISPASKSYTPVSTFISVDFPAPFSPIRACISPFLSVKSTPLNAFTPGKVLLIPRMVKTSFSFICTVSFHVFLKTYEKSNFSKNTLKLSYIFNKIRESGTAFNSVTVHSLSGNPPTKCCTFKNAIRIL